MGVSISIIIPVYNVEKYLHECLDSVLNQTIPFDEIIIINDGSTDTSGVICRNYKSQNPRIVLLEQENSGLSSARNAGLEAAKGDYVIFLDSDDFIDLKTCETIKSVLETDDLIDVVYYASDTIKEIPFAFSQEGYTRYDKITGKIICGFASLEKLFPEHYKISACMSAYQTSFLKKNDIRFINGILYEDRFFCLRVITESQRVLYIPDRLYVRRFRQGSIVTSRGNRKKIQDIIYGHELEWNYIKDSEKWEHNKSLTQYYVLRAFNMVFQNEVSSFGEKKERETYIKSFWEFWGNYFDVGIMTINELTFWLFVLKKMQTYLSVNSLLKYFESEEKFSVYKNKIGELLVDHCRKKLGSLPLNEKKRICIYGIGRHTECMLELYKTMVGEIISDVYFSVSQGTKEKVFCGKELRQVTNLYPNTEYIIISSKLYQAEMRKYLEQIGVNKQRIIELYGINDGVDFVTIYDTLSE